MLATPSSNIAEALVKLFLRDREITAEQAHQLINKHHFSCSLRAVYKELAQLIRSGVVIKIQRFYSLSITWILNLIDVAENLYTVSVHGLPQCSRLPQEGEKLTWKFNDLQHMDRFWLQLMFLLFAQSRTRVMFAWVPYFWFDIVHIEKDLEAQEAMRIAGNKMYMLLGSRTFLETLPLKYWSKEVYVWSHAESPFAAQRSRYFDVIDDFVLTVTLDTKTTMAIHELFQSIRSKSDLHRVRAFDAIKSAAKVRMTLEHNAQKARRLRRKCCAFFGIVDPGISN